MTKWDFIFLGGLAAGASAITLLFVIGLCVMAKRGDRQMRASQPRPVFDEAARDNATRRLRDRCSA